MHNAFVAPDLLCALGLAAVQAADLDHLLAQMGNHPAGKEVRWGPVGEAEQARQ